MLFSKRKEEIVLEIEGMHCMMCSGKVEKSLNALKGVSKARVDLAAKKATVLFDPDTVTKDDMVKAVSDAGFTAN